MSNPFIKLILPQLIYFLAQRYDEYRRKQRERQWREAAQRCEQAHPITVIKKTSLWQIAVWAMVSLVMGTGIGIGLAQIPEIQTQLGQIRHKLSL